MVFRPLKKVGLHALLLFLLPVTLVILTCLWLLRQIAGIWLKLRLQRQFGGLINSSDKVYTPTKLIVILTYVRSEQKFNTVEQIRLKLQEKVFGHDENYPKLKCTYHKFLGQDYFLKHQVGVEDVLTELPLPIDNATAFDENYVKSYINILENSLLPKNDTALWQIHASPKPLEYPSINVKGYLYPVIFRFHHCVGDGMSLSRFLSQLMDAKCETNHCEKILKNLGPQSKIKECLKTTISLLQFLLIGPGTFLTTIFKEAGKNPLCGKKLSGKKFVVWAIGNETIGQVNTIKKIKNCIPNTYFSDVLFTCISGAFYTYFRNAELTEKPVKLNCLLPLLHDHGQTDATKPVELKNRFTFGVLDLPLVDPEEKSLAGLVKVKSSLNALRKGYEKEMLFWLSNYIAAVVPASVGNVLMNSSSYAVAISSFPGVSKMKVLDGCEFSSIIPVAPNTNHTGLTMTIFTYDDKFHISLNVDKALIWDPKEAQFIVDEVLKNMERLLKRVFDE